MPSIAICGAGPAGLTLARLLQQASLPETTPLEITVFEKDESPQSRFYQGGTLDLHDKTGQAALKAAGLWDEFLRHARFEGEELLFGDKNATVFVHVKEQANIPGATARPEIDRENLKDLLLHSVKPEIIRWGKHVKTVDGETGILSFADGTSAGPFDLVVGADGAWSKVRSVVTDVKPNYSGICGLEANVTPQSAGDEWESISKQVGQGSYFSFSDGKSLGAQRMGDGTLKIATWRRLENEPSWPADTVERTGGDEEQIKQVLLSLFEDWDPSMKRWISCAHRFRPWPLYELPVGHTWTHCKGFTLIGDSAHLMTPFAGEGVNAAMRDALELSQRITDALSSQPLSSPSSPPQQQQQTPGMILSMLDAAVSQYEQDSFPRNTKVQEETVRNKYQMFRPEGPVAFMASFVDMVAGELGWDLDHGLVLRWIPLRKIAYAWFWSIERVGIWRRMVRESRFLRL